MDDEGGEIAGLREGHFANSKGTEGRGSNLAPNHYLAAWKSKMGTSGLGGDRVSEQVLDRDQCSGFVRAGPSLG